VVSSHRYLPFGEEIEPVLIFSDGFESGDTSRWTVGYEKSLDTGPPEVIKFTGHERDLRAPESNDDLDYMHARYYNPYLGRFLSADQVGGRVGSLQSWNRYSYVENNPSGFVDPDGRQKRALKVWQNKQYLIKLYKGDTYHGGRHYHIVQRKGGKLIGRVSGMGKVLTGNVPKSVLRFMARGGLIGSAASIVMTPGVAHAEEIYPTPDQIAADPALMLLVVELLGLRDLYSLSTAERRQLLQEAERRSEAEIEPKSEEGDEREDESEFVEDAQDTPTSDRTE
jgi:RHS repeat-associated protein